MQESIIPQRTYRIKNHALALVLLGALAVVLFSPFFFAGRAFLAADIQYTYYPFKSLAPEGFKPHNLVISDPLSEYYASNYDDRADGSLANWNPYIFTGLPAYMSPTMGMNGRFYPIKRILYELLPPYQALSWLLFIHVLAMGIGMYFYLNRIGGGTRGALFGAIAYMFNGYSMAWLEYETWVIAFAYMPLILLTMEGFLEKNRWKCSILGSVALGAIALAGNVQVLLYVFMLCSFYFVFLLIRMFIAKTPAREYASALGCFSVLMILGLALGAIDFIPTLDLISRSQRIAKIYDMKSLFETTARVPFRYLITLIFPDFFGNPSNSMVDLLPKLQSQKYMNFNELCIYTGVVPLLAAVGAFFGSRGRHVWFFGLISVLSLLMMTGTFVYYPFFKLIPGLDKVNPTRVIMLFSFSVSVLAGLGIGGTGKTSDRAGRAFIAIIVSAFVCAFAFGIAAEGERVFSILNSELWLMEKYRTSFIDLARQHRAITSPVIFKPLAIMLAGTGLIIFYVKRKGTGRAVFLALCGVMAFELISFGLGYNTTSKPETIYPRTAGIEYLKSREGKFRVLLAEKELYPNSLAHYGIEEAGGYSSLFDSRFNELASYAEIGKRSLSGNKFDRWVVYTHPDSKLLDLMNVRYYVTAPGRSPGYDKFVKVYDGDIAIHENRNFVPRAYMVYDYSVISDPKDILNFMASDGFKVGRQAVLEKKPPVEPLSAPLSSLPEVLIQRYENDRVNIRVNTEADGLLILSDAYYPGWVAQVDDKETEIYRANYNFRALPLKAGSHSVSFSFEPVSVKLGRLISMLSAIGAVAGFFAVRRMTA